MSAEIYLGWYQRRRRFALAVLIAAVFAALLVVGTSTQLAETLHEPVEQVGMILMVVAILGRMWCTLYIGGRKSAEIVTFGPYSMTRNPLYVFSTVGAAGVGAMSGSIIVALAFAVITAVAFHFIICGEESHLERSFGEPYRAYMAKVPRFFPDLRLFWEKDVLTVRPKLLYRTFTDGLVFVVAYPFFETVEYLQRADILPVLIHLY